MSVEEVSSAESAAECPQRVSNDLAPGSRETANNYQDQPHLPVMPIIPGSIGGLGSVGGVR